MRVVGGDSQSPYINYRVIPTKLSELFMAQNEVEKQKEELTLSLGNMEEGTLPLEGGDTACAVCLSFKATRMCSPCGHMVACKPCATSMTNNNYYYEVTRGDGSVLTTHIRLPLTCPICRAIIGLFIKPF